MKKLLPLLVFIGVCVTDLLGIYLENQTIINIVKPLLMPTLFWYYMTNKETINVFFITGLFFSFLGDVFLLGKGELYFILGLVFFLTAHIFYILLVSKQLIKLRLKNLSLAAFPYLIIFIILINLLYESLGAMKIPVIIYAITISVLGTISLLLYIQKRTSSNLLLVIGVFIFIISDSVLAINLFYKPHSIYPLLIILTYVLAQFLICKFVLNLKQTK